MVPTTRLLLLEQRDQDQAIHWNENTTHVVPVAASTENSVAPADASIQNVVPAADSTRTTLNTPEPEPTAPPDGNDEQWEHQQYVSKNRPDDI